jgi:hypothetical protein
VVSVLPRRDILTRSGVRKIVYHHMFPLRRNFLKSKISHSVVVVSCAVDTRYSPRIVILIETFAHIIESKTVKHYIWRIAINTTATTKFKSISIALKTGNQFGH